MASPNKISCSAGGYDASTTGNMLKQMEKQGLIRREPHPEDGRAKLVYLTDKGRTLQARLWKESRPLRETIWNALTHQERQVLAKSAGQNSGRSGG